MRKVFEHRDRKFLYDLDELPTVAYRRAHAIYLFQSQVLQSPPATYREYEASGAADADERAFSYLLMELDEEGDPKPYRGAKSAEAAQKFLSVLPSKWRKDLEECRKHFFDEAELLNIVSLKQLGALVGASTSGVAASTLFRRLMENNGTDERSLNDDSSSSNGSISPENSTDDSNSATPTAPTTTGPSDSSPEEPRGRSTVSE